MVGLLFLIAGAVLVATVFVLSGALAVRPWFRAYFAFAGGWSRAQPFVTRAAQSGARGEIAALIRRIFAHRNHLQRKVRLARESGQPREKS